MNRLLPASAGSVPVDPSPEMVVLFVIVIFSLLRVPSHVSGIRIPVKSLCQKAKEKKRKEKNAHFRGTDQQGRNPTSVVQICLTRFVPREAHHSLPRSGVPHIYQIFFPLLPSSTPLATLATPFSTPSVRPCKPSPTALVPVVLLIVCPTP